MLFIVDRVRSRHAVFHGLVVCVRGTFLRSRPPVASNEGFAKAVQIEVEATWQGRKAIGIRFGVSTLSPTRNRFQFGTSRFDSTHI